MSTPKFPCAICGVREAKGRDHVPPKAIFTKPFPLNLITVPACEICNNGSSNLDEQFRVYLGMLVGDKSELAKRLWKERSMATLRKNRKLVSSASEGMFEVPLHDQNGNFLGQRTAFAWPADVFESVVERIARGLYYHHYKEILGTRARCNVGFLRELDAEFLSSTSDWSTNHIGGGAFSYRYARAPERPLYSLWVMEFYQGHWASVETWESEA